MMMMTRYRAKNGTTKRPVPNTTYVPSPLSPLLTHSLTPTDHTVRVVPRHLPDGIHVRRDAPHRLERRQIRSDRGVRRGRCLYWALGGGHVDKDHFELDLCAALYVEFTGAGALA